ncbi:MAG: glutamine--fructose-6-phosphate transaminase (isomerizing) [Clostridia bacterium]|nr:glutamine--fructose-6-phosphate transaminase (isomerizing) [Clostridia bacterium]
MCGIIGCIGEDAVNKTYKGLVRLEYRGYDSAGVAVLDGGNICTIKRTGMVSALKEELTSLCGGAAIGHTRWATHGAPSDINAHPHTAGKFSVVHNGIIENYAELRAELAAEGYVFKSQTDSETVVYLLNKYYRGSFPEAVKNTVKRLKGSFALGILCSECNCIAAVRYRNPIIIAEGKNCCFLSSDMPALAGEADKACILKDGQMAFLTKNGVKLYDFDLNEVNFTYVPVKISAGDTSLQGFPHYMLKEIYEIPAAVKNTLSAIDSSCENALKRLYYRVNRIILTGCGTAFNSTLAASYVMEEALGVPVLAEVASELRYRFRVMDENTLLIAVSQSGETADTVEAARSAKEKGVKTVAVTNVSCCALNGLADVAIPVRAGTEVCVAATKSYCGQIAALLKITEILSGEKIGGLENLSDMCEHMARCTDVQALAALCARSKGVYFIGRGIDYPAALEGSLKLKEVSYIAGEGYPAGELKHGPLALIDGDTLTVAIAADSRLAKKTASSAEQIRSRGGKTAVIAAKSCLAEGLEEGADVCIEIPDCDWRLSPALTVIPLQLAAYYAAVICGRNPDKPRNLAKSVTVE